MPPDGTALAMLDDPRIAYIEENALSFPPSFENANSAASLVPASSADASPTRLSVESTAEISTANWHLDRIDDPHPYLDGTFTITTEARNVVAYVIDTGVWSGHSEFEGRVYGQLDFSEDKGTTGIWNNDQTNGCTTDMPGMPEDVWHGTAVASLLAGNTVGVARPMVISLKVGRCEDGAIATVNVIRAIEFISSPQYNIWYSYPGVINFSGFSVPGDPNFNAIRDAARATVAATGFPFFTSADNWSGDACKFSPNVDAYTSTNTAGRVFVVGGTSPPFYTWPYWEDFRWQEADPNTGLPATFSGSGSNTGACVSIFAPAKSVTSARHEKFADVYGSLYGTRSGTSFSSPLAAGVAARYIARQIATTGVRPGYAQVYSFLTTNAVVPVSEPGITPYSMCIYYNGLFFHAVEPVNGSCQWSHYTLIDMTASPTNGKMLYFSE